MGVNIKNAKKPKGLGGRKMCKRMNDGHHKELAEWGLDFIEIEDNSLVVDIGCGGGGNVARMLDKFSGGKVVGVDYSKTSVRVAKKVNKQAIENGRCEILNADVCDLPFERESVDIITAFETVYFWKDLQGAFIEIYSVLKNDGTFLICNEADGMHESDARWVDDIGDMIIYTGEELKSELFRAGFIKVEINGVEEKHWLTVKAVK